MMKVRYSDLKEFDKVQFPSNVAVSIQQKKQRMSLEFQIERAVFNTDLTVSPIDVTRYTKVVVTQLLP